MTEEGKQLIRQLCCTDEIADELIKKVEKEEKEKTRCEYPMSNFYTYQEDVPPNTRVSNDSDCESCKDHKECGEGYCLITENPGEEIEKEVHCENHCPCCGSDDINWGLSESVSDEWYHQRGSCNKCGHCFTEVSELVYKSTLVNEDKDV